MYYSKAYYEAHLKNWVNDKEFDKYYALAKDNPDIRLKRPATFFTRSKPVNIPVQVQLFFNKNLVDFTMYEVTMQGESTAVGHYSLKDYKSDPSTEVQEEATTTTTTVKETTTTTTKTVDTSTTTQAPDKKKRVGRPRVKKD